MITINHWDFRLQCPKNKMVEDVEFLLPVNFIKFDSVVVEEKLNML